MRSSGAVVASSSVMSDVVNDGCYNSDVPGMGEYL